MNPGEPLGSGRLSGRAASGRHPGLRPWRWAARTPATPCSAKRPRWGPICSAGRSPTHEDHQPRSGRLRRLERTAHPGTRRRDERPLRPERGRQDDAAWSSSGRCSTASRPSGAAISRRCTGAGAGGRSISAARTGGSRSPGTPPPTASPGEQLSISAPDGTRQGEHFLKVLLSNVDEAVFNNVFAVGLREIQELATLSDTAAAELLYSLTAGLDRVSLVEVMRELEASRNRILDAAGGPCQVVQLLAEHEKLRAEIQDLAAIGHRYAHLAAERGQLDGEITRLEEEANRTQQLAQTTDAALAVHDLWHQRAALDEQLAAFGPAKAMPDGRPRAARCPGRTHPETPTARRATLADSARVAAGVRRPDGQRRAVAPLRPHRGHEGTGALDRPIAGRNRRAGERSRHARSRVGRRGPAVGTLWCRRLACSPAQRRRLHHNLFLAACQRTLVAPLARQVARRGPRAAKRPNRRPTRPPPPPTRSASKSNRPWRPAASRN